MSSFDYCEVFFNYTNERMKWEIGDCFQYTMQELPHLHKELFNVHDTNIAANEFDI